VNFSQFVGLQNSPNLSKIEKVAETCEFDEKSFGGKRRSQYYLFLIIIGRDCRVAQNAREKNAPPEQVLLLSCGAWLTLTVLAAFVLSCVL